MNAEFKCKIDRRDKRGSDQWGMLVLDVGPRLAWGLQSWMWKQDEAIQEGTKWKDKILNLQTLKPNETHLYKRFLIVMFWLWMGGEWCGPFRRTTLIPHVSFQVLPPGQADCHSYAGWVHSTINIHSKLILGIFHCFYLGWIPFRCHSNPILYGRVFWQTWRLTPGFQWTVSFVKQYFQNQIETTVVFLSVWLINWGR